MKYSTRFARVLVGGAALACVAASSGCNNAGEGMFSGAAIGSGVGAGIGAIAAGGEGAWMGAAIGAIGGALGGAIIGDQNARNAQRSYGYYAPQAQPEPTYYNAQPTYYSQPVYYAQPAYYPPVSFNFGYGYWGGYRGRGHCR